MEKLLNFFPVIGIVIIVLFGAILLRKVIKDSCNEEMFFDTKYFELDDIMREVDWDLEKFREVTKPKYKKAFVEQYIKDRT